jgi:hypothetical protein
METGLGHRQQETYLSITIDAKRKHVCIKSVGELRKNQLNIIYKCH